MLNFKIFSSILAVVVVIMVVQLVFTDYLSDFSSINSSNIKTDVINKLGSDLEDNIDGLNFDYFSFEEDDIFGNNFENISATLVEEDDPIVNELAFLDQLSLPPIDITLGEGQSASNFQSLDNPEILDGVVDFEKIDVKSISVNPYIRPEQIRSAGFVTAYLQEESNDTLLYKTVYIGDMDSVLKKRYVIRDDTHLYARVYVFSPDANNTVENIYNTLKIKCDNAPNSSINETNQFGVSSFYMNDVLRNDVAFLNVRYNAIVYSFSYPKIYHTQVSNLIKLIGLEK